MRRRFIAGLGLALVATPLSGLATTTAQGESPTAAAAGEPAKVRLWAPTSSIGFTEGRYTYLNLGARLAADDVPFEVRAHRPSYKEEITANWTSGSASGTLPQGMIASFSEGLTDFMRVVIRNGQGEIVGQQIVDTCLNGSTERSQPEAPPRSPYPTSCPYNPYTRGSVQGVQAGWHTLLDTGYGIHLDPGKYTATVRITQAWKQALGIPESAASRTVALTIKTYDDGHHRRTTATSRIAQPNDVRPKGTSGGRLAGPAPDLRALPAFGMSVGGANGEILRFGANVWNAGDSPLVIDGFRRDGEDIMDAYQYFFDSAGNQTGYQKIGLMHFHDAPSHMHWHLLNFARYSLVDADKQEVLRSRKQSFCLANTDAIDYTVPGADWNPYNTDLQTACGGIEAYSIREVLSSGSGDTYFQDRAGQAFNLTGLPNGRYYVKIEANPYQKLVEQNLSNNISYRPIWVGGVPGKRTVHMAKVGIIDEDWKY